MAVIDIVGGTVKERAFSLVEILVVLAIIAVVVAIIFPIFISAEKSGQTASCLSNIRQIGLGALQYSTDNDEKVGFNTLGGNIWLKNIGMTAQGKYGYLPKVACPTLRKPADYGLYSSGYGFNTCTPEKLPPNLSRTAMIGDAAIFFPIGKPKLTMSTDFLYFPDSFWSDLSPWIIDTNGSKYEPVGEWGATRHQGKGNYVFFDGHAKSFPPDAFRIPQSGHPCESRPSAWRGPSDGPVFNPAGAV